MKTYTFGNLDPLNPHPKDIHIGDIAEALAHENRYANQTRAKISVAEHSIQVARSFEEPLLALFALLHDASEAYLRDLPAEVKHAPEMGGYREIEHHLQDTIFDSLCPRIPTKDENYLIKDREAALFHTEFNEVWDELTPTYSPTVAKQKFVSLYYKLRADAQAEIDKWRDEIILAYERRAA